MGVLGNLQRQQSTNRFSLNRQKCRSLEKFKTIGCSKTASDSKSFSQIFRKIVEFSIFRKIEN